MHYFVLRILLAFESLKIMQVSLHPLMIDTDSYVHTSLPRGIEFFYLSQKLSTNLIIKTNFDLFFICFLIHCIISLDFLIRRKTIGKIGSTLVKSKESMICYTWITKQT